MIYKISQCLNIPLKEVLYEWSYENLLLMMASAPNFRSKANESEDSKEKKWDERLDANNPDNFRINQNSSMEDEEYVY